MRQTFRRAKAELRYLIFLNGNELKKSAVILCRWQFPITLARHGSRASMTLENLFSVCQPMTCWQSKPKARGNIVPSFRKLAVKRITFLVVPNKIRGRFFIF